MDQSLLIYNANNNNEIRISTKISASTVMSMFFENDELLINIEVSYQFHVFIRDFTCSHFPVTLCAYR